jgi:replicative DNA helicase
MSIPTAQKWKPQKQAYQEAINYMLGRKEGRITSIKTPWKKFNDAIADGIEWNSTTVIAGRPASGKTLIKDQIVRSAFELNEKNFRVLEFQFEMVGRVSAMRSFSASLDRTYKYLCSAEGTVTEEDLKRCVAYAKKMSTYPIDVVDEPATVAEIRQIIVDYMMLHSKLVTDEHGNEVRVFTNTMVTLDHSLLVKKAPFEKDKMDTLFAFGEMLTALKRKFPIAFIVLSQLNREIDKPERNEEGKYGNHVLESDLYGADALLQHADTVIGVDRPGKRNLFIYGPNRYLIADKNVLIFHFIKARNGDTQMSFMTAEFKKMSVSEMDVPPPQSELRMRTRS